MQSAECSLNKNLDQISRYNSFLARKILNHNKPHGYAEFIESNSSSINLLYNNILIHDQIDPINEAIDLLNSLSRNNSKDITVIYGLGLGYTLKRFADDYKGNIIVFDPSLDILRITFEAVDFSQEFGNPKILITNIVEDITRHIMRFFNEDCKVHFLALDSYKQLFPEIYELVSNEVQYSMPEEYTGGELNINIGSGKWKKPGWKTLDCYRFATFYRDLRTIEPLPLEDNVITKAFCSHCIEHIEDHHLENLLKEIYRCMKPGGLFRISCPDAQLAFDAYERDDADWFRWLKKNNIGAMLVNTFVSYQNQIGGPEVDDRAVKEKFETLDKEEFIKWAVSLKDLNKPYIAHTNGFTYEKLSRKLEEAGFVNIKHSGYKQSSDPELRLSDFDLHPSISLYVECFKP
ncbi:MAG: hypothetical protein A2039_08130 [Candidatus Melainabacteria bacterium GWA2_34_9]|nr:MAG: hypothetical protein A2039_08130 [Candidatus Melainabacteria bacterium GWA2_34_9]